MAEQGTHKPLVGSSNLPVATELSVALPVGVPMLHPTARIVTPVTWLAAPDWLTPQQASELSGHDLDVIYWLVLDGAVDTKVDGDTHLIEKAGLHDFQESLLLVARWNSQSCARGRVGCNHAAGGLRPAKDPKPRGRNVTPKGERYG